MRAASARLFQRRQHRRKLCQNTDDPDNQAEEHNFFHGCPPNFRTPYDAIAAKDVPGQGGVEAEPPGVCQRLTCSNWTGRTCGGSPLRPAKQDCRGCSRGTGRSAVIRAHRGRRPDHFRARLPDGLGRDRLRNAGTYPTAAVECEAGSRQPCSIRVLHACGFRANWGPRERPVPPSRSFRDWDNGTGGGSMNESLGAIRFLV